MSEPLIIRPRASDFNALEGPDDAFTRRGASQLRCSGPDPAVPAARRRPIRRTMQGMGSHRWSDLKHLSESASNGRATGSDGSILSQQDVDHSNVRPDGTINALFHCH